VLSLHTHTHAYVYLLGLLPTWFCHHHEALVGPIPIPIGGRARVGVIDVVSLVVHVAHGERVKRGDEYRVRKCVCACLKGGIL
jgi:hypothetical protein